MGKSSNPTFAGDKEFEKIHLKEKSFPTASATLPVTLSTP